MLLIYACWWYAYLTVGVHRPEKTEDGDGKDA